MSAINPENTCAHLKDEMMNLPVDELPTINGMFEMQLHLQKRFAEMGKAVHPDAKLQDKVKDISTQWRNLTLEFSELLERLPFKEWKTYSNEDLEKAFSEENMLETKFEYIDMFHFFMNIGLLLGIDGEEFSRLYMVKNRENHNRQKNGY